MNDIERRLRELGQRVHDDNGSRASLDRGTLRRIRLRRLTTMATSVVVVVALGIGGSYVAGAFSEQERLDVAGPDDVGFARYTPHFSAQQFATLELNVDHQTICYSVDALPNPSSISRLAIFEANQDGRHSAEVGISSAGSLIELVPNAAHFSPSEGDDCVGSISRETLTAIIKEPGTYLLLVDYRDGGLPLSARLTAPAPGGRCTRAVEFEPTYLPEGWTEYLQPGDGGGGEFRGIVGHYGSDAPAGTTRKARIGFADLISGERPYQQGNVEEIRVLGRSATLGDIHEGYSVEFTRNGCDYFLIGFGITRDELRRFAQGLRVSGTTPPEPAEEEDFAAIWPEDTAREANQVCNETKAIEAWRTDAIRAAEEFGHQVLGWEPAALVRHKEDRRVDVELRRATTDDGAKAQGPAVMVYMTEVFDDCWSVGSVGRPPDNKPTGVGISVRGRHVEVGFDHLGADSVYFQIGHGKYTNTADPEPPDGHITAFLTYKPNHTGHFLLLFKDEYGEVFSATGGPLPAGDFAAG